jgi:hypothetical protein
MRHAFEAALDEAGRAKTEDAPGPPHVRFNPELSPAPVGHHLLWESAAVWTPEADLPPPEADLPPPEADLPPPAPAPEPPRPSAAPEDIAGELGLSALKTPAEVAHVRRRFMWANHPDRCVALDRDLANRRVAVANMLLDRVQWLLARGRGR